MHLVLDEWLWSDLYGENGVGKQMESYEFLHKVYHKCDQLVIVRRSKFEKKFWRFRKFNDVKRRKISKFFHRYFYCDSEKTLLLEPDELTNFPQELENRVNIDDRYLIQAQITSTPSTLVTTDNDLHLASISYNLRSELRDNFIELYPLD